ncbi:MAG: iron-sulfur cluster assembly protein, partial [Rhodothermales bacterium]|nr:iron-sulfur cluster assembly protein [Rhodothermales bacterium]
MNTTPRDVLQALKSVIEPDSQKDIVRRNLVRRLRVAADEVSFEILLKDPTSDFAGKCKELCEAALREAGITVPATISVDSEMISLGELQADRTAPGQVL